MSRWKRNLVFRRSNHKIVIKTVLYLERLNHNDHYQSSCKLYHSRIKRLALTVIEGIALQSLCLDSRLVNCVLLMVLLEPYIIGFCCRVSNLFSPTEPSVCQDWLRHCVISQTKLLWACIIYQKFQS